MIKQGLWKATVQAAFSSCTPKHNIVACLVAIRRERKAIAKSDFRLPHTSPSACLLNISLKQRGSHWTDFSEILRWGFLVTSACRIEIWFKSDKNNGHFG